MSFDILTKYVDADVAGGGTILFPYAAGKAASDYSATGAVLSAPGLQAEHAGVVVSLGVSGATAAYPAGKGTVPKGGKTYLQLARATADVSSATALAEALRVGVVTVAAAGVVLAADPETGHVSRTVADKARETISVTDFIASADGSNRSQAFQRAYNYLYDQGGGTLEVPQGTYVLGRYPLADVGSRILWNMGLTSASGYAHHTAPPSNIIVRGLGRPTLQFPRDRSSAGGNTNDQPYGYGGSWQMLASSAGPDAEYTTYTVSTVVRDGTGHGVTLSSVSGLAVGQVVMVEGDQANTPSAENSPLQFLTIASISTLTVYFAEKFFHYFESAISGLTLKLCSRLGGWTSNIQYENLRFEGTDPDEISYFLVSRTNGARFYNIECKRFVIGTGRSQNIDIKGFRSWDGGKLFIEATSRYTVDDFDIDASGLITATTLGGIYINDNAKRGLIKNGRISGAKRNGMSLLWGTEAMVRDVVLEDCAGGSDAVVTYQDEDAALRLGHSMTAAVHSTRTAASSIKFKEMQTPSSKIVLQNVEFRGQTKRAIVAGNTDLAMIGRIFIGHTGAATPIELGQTGTKTADATYFPLGGQGSLLLLGDLIIETDQAATLIPLKTTYGGRGYLRAPDSTLASDMAAGATSLVVANSTRFSTSMRTGVAQVDHPTNFAPFTVTVSAITDSTNTLTISASSTAAVAGSGVFYYEDENLLSKIDTTNGRVLVNGARSKVPRAGWLTNYPTTATGGGPYTGSFTANVPGEGEWQLDLIYLSQDKGHRVRSSYIVNYSNEYAAFPANIISSAFNAITLRTACAFGTHSVAAGVVTLNLSSTVSGKTGVVYYRWTPLASMQVTLSVS